MWQEAEKVLEVESREAEFRVRREVEEAKREAEAAEAELKRAKVRTRLLAYLCWPTHIGLGIVCSIEGDPQ